MPFPTFVPTIAPSPGTSISTKVALNEATFGDGYAQASPKGINSMRRQVSYRWDALTATQATEIENFFRERGGFRPFWWTARRDVAPSKWTCRDWTVTDGAPWSITATFTEWFGPET